MSRRSSAPLRKGKDPQPLFGLARRELAVWRLGWIGHTPQPLFGRVLESLGCFGVRAATPWGPAELLPGMSDPAVCISCRECGMLLYVWGRAPRKQCAKRSWPTRTALEWNGRFAPGNRPWQYLILATSTLQRCPVVSKHRRGPLNQIRKNPRPVYLDLRAVIASQYTKPGVKPTIRGIHTGHPSVTSDMVWIMDSMYLSLPAMIPPAKSGDSPRPYMMPLDACCIPMCGAGWILMVQCAAVCPYTWA